MNKVVEEALSWVGTPYQSCAAVKGVGVDCGQLLIRCAEDSGYIPKGTIHTGAYSNEWHLHRSEEKYLSFIEKYCDKVEGTPKSGDFIVYKFGRCVSHGAIVLEWPRVIHAYVRLGVIISDNFESILLNKKGKSRMVGCYRLKGVS